MQQALDGVAPGDTITNDRFAPDGNAYYVFADNLTIINETGFLSGTYILGSTITQFAVSGLRDVTVHDNQGVRPPNSALATIS